MIGEGNENVIVYRIVPALLASAAMAGDYLCPGAFEHLGVFHCAFNVGEDPEFGCDWDGKILVEGVDCDKKTCVSRCLRE